MKRPRRYAPESIEALKGVVVKAMAHVREYRTRDQERLADVYAGRDKGGVLFSQPPAQGMPIEEWVREAKTGSRQSGTTTANLLTSRLIQIFVASTPGRPQITIEPKTAGALMLAEAQEAVTDQTMSGTKLAAAVKRAAWLDPIQNYVGLRLFYNERARDATEKAVFKVIESEECGEEPFSRRFEWHSRIEQWGSLSDDLRKRILANVDHDEEPSPWEPVALTEVFDKSFALETGESKRDFCRAHIFANLTGKFYKERRTKMPDIGDYIVTHDLRCSPLIIEANMEPGPLEDVAPAEAAQWMGTLDRISDTLEQICREIQAVNNIGVYDADNITQELMKLVMSLPPGTPAWIPVTGVGQSAQGISHRIRPIERNSVLAELITGLQILLAMLDDVTGVGPQDRGVSINPSKSATEAGVLSASSSRRTAARLATQDRRWSRAGALLFEYQREYYGRYLTVPLGDAERTYEIPDPETCRFAFEVGLDEMQNLSRRNRVDVAMMALTTLVRSEATFPQGKPKIIREAERQVLRGLGWKDHRAWTVEPYTDDSPQDRLMEHLTNGGKKIPVNPDDDHTVFIGFYGKKMAQWVSQGRSDAPITPVQNAIQEHQILLKQREAMMIKQSANPSPIPGMSAQGELDNNLSAQMESGQSFEISPQLLGQ